jgi:hypothetical protein
MNGITVNNDTGAIDAACVPGAFSHLVFLDKPVVSYIGIKAGTTSPMTTIAVLYSWFEAFNMEYNLNSDNKVNVPSSWSIRPCSGKATKNKHFLPFSFKVAWILLILIVFGKAASGQLLQGAEYRPWEDFLTPRGDFCQEGVSSVLIVREEDEVGSKLRYLEFDRNGKVLTDLDQIGFHYMTYEYTSPHTKYAKAYLPTGEMKEGWHLNFPEQFKLAFLFRLDLDEKGNWYRESAAWAPISSDTIYETVLERKIGYGKDSIVVLEPDLAGTCWDLRSVYDASGKLRSEMLIPQDTACQERIYFDSLSYRTGERTWRIVPGPGCGLPVREIRMKDDEQIEKIWEISRKGKRTLSQKNFFSRNGLIKRSAFYDKGSQSGSLTYTYNENDLKSETRYNSRSGTRITTRYRYTFFR